MVPPYPEELMMNSDWIMAATGSARVGARERDNQEGKVQEQKRSGTNNASAVNPSARPRKCGSKSAASPESPGAAKAGLARAAPCERAGYCTVQDQTAKAIRARAGLFRET